MSSNNGSWDTHDRWRPPTTGSRDETRLLAAAGQEEDRCVIVQNTVVRLRAKVIGTEVRFNLAKKAVESSPGSISISLTKASVTELEQAASYCRKQGSKAELETITKMLALVRDQKPAEAAPLKIEIVNAAEFNKNSLITITRDSDGDMSGAIVDRLPI